MNPNSSKNKWLKGFILSTLLVIFVAGEHFLWKVIDHAPKNPQMPKTIAVKLTDDVYDKAGKVKLLNRGRTMTGSYEVDERGRVSMTVKVPLEKEW